jgi:hypothetical protein
MNVNIFILCYNEEVLIKHTLDHYLKYLPSVHITILNNHSTDNSINIAKTYGVDVVDWGNPYKMDCKAGTIIRNNIWKSVKCGWIIMVDMDEFLCITEHELLEEMQKGTTILSTRGMDMIGESKFEDLHDINLQDIKKYVFNHWLSKPACFNKDYINEINYLDGAHNAEPIGLIKFSENIYKIKHMNLLGIPYLINRYIKAFLRSKDDRNKGMATHYTDNINSIKERYYSSYRKHLIEE